MTEAVPEQRVLVVDDDFMVAEIHRRFVDGTPGFRSVGIASTAEQCWERIAELEPDLVLLDVYLPDGSGLDVLRRIRAEGRDAGVIMITAAREVDAVSAALHGGANDYLVKPFDTAQLRRKLEGFRSRKRILEATEHTDQGTIDALFGGTRSASSPMPKGLSTETGALVLEVVRARGEVSAAECADGAGLSRVSARRYLEHFLVTGAVDIRLQYGRAGRPQRLYRAV